jgi:protein SCO1/2
MVDLSTRRRSSRVVVLGFALAGAMSWALWPQFGPQREGAEGSVLTTEVDAEQLRRAHLMDELMAGKVEGGGFALVDQTGATRTLSEFHGQLVVMYFGYTSCPGICPSDLSQIGAIVRALGGDGARVQPLFITIDPERDTPSRLSAYLANFDPSIIGLTGGLEEITRVADRYNAYFAKVPVEASEHYMMDHSAYIYLLDRNGAFLGAFPSGTKVDRLAQAVGTYLQ